MPRASGDCHGHPADAGGSWRITPASAGCQRWVSVSNTLPATHAPHPPLRGTLSRWKRGTAHFFALPQTKIGARSEDRAPGAVVLGSLAPRTAVAHLRGAPGNALVAQVADHR